MKHTVYHYPERHKPNGEPPVYPDACPLCGEPIAFAKQDRFRGPVYQCGGRYSFKPQIQNHTDKWWGICPPLKEQARLERGRVCDGCGDKRLEGTGFPIESFGWKCHACGHKHEPSR